MSRSIGLLGPEYYTAFSNKCLVGQWQRRVDSQFFVANVNVNDDGKLNANVNRLENDNVWNGVYQHRVIVPVTSMFSRSMNEREFSSQGRVSSHRSSCRLLPAVRREPYIYHLPNTCFPRRVARKISSYQVFVRPIAVFVVYNLSGDKEKKIVYPGILKTNFQFFLPVCNDIP